MAAVAEDQEDLESNKELVIRRQRRLHELQSFVSDASRQSAAESAIRRTDVASIVSFCSFVFDMFCLCVLTCTAAALLPTMIE